MTLEKLERSVEHLRYGELALGPEGLATLRALGVDTVGDLLWRLAAAGPDDAAAEPSQDAVGAPRPLDVLVSAGRLYLVRGMSAELAVGLAAAGVASPEALAEADLRELERVAGELSELEHPPQTHTLSRLQVNAARLDGCGHLFGRLISAETGEPLRDARVWAGAVQADMGDAGAFALIGLAEGERQILAGAPEHVPVRLAMEVRPDDLAPPLELSLAAAAPDGGIPPEELREGPGRPFREHRLGRTVERRLEDLPDDTYLIVDDLDGGRLVHLFRVRTGDDIATEVCLVDPSELPAGAEAGAIVRLGAGRLEASELTIEQFGLLKAGLPEGLLQ